MRKIFTQAAIDREHSFHDLGTLFIATPSEQPYYARYCVVVVEQYLFAALLKIRARLTMSFSDFELASSAVDSSRITLGSKPAAEVSASPADHCGMNDLARSDRRNRQRVLLFTRARSLVARCRPPTAHELMKWTDKNPQTRLPSPHRSHSPRRYSIQVSFSAMLESAGSFLDLLRARNNSA